MKLNAISKKYPNANVLDNFSLDLPKCGIIAIMGSSGSGKTTLLNVISGILQPDSGHVDKSERCSFIFQEDRLLPWLNALENIEIVLDKKQQAKGGSLKLLYDLGLSGLENQPLQSLSGGMQRRIAIARALAYDAPLMLMDEPFKGLDTAIKKQVMDVVLDNSFNKLVLLVTHDIYEALYLADRLYLMEGPPLRIIRSIEIPEHQIDRHENPDFWKKYNSILK